MASLPPIQKLLKNLSDDPSFIDLTDSRFHQNGFLPPRKLYENGFLRYLDTRNYAPDSRGEPKAREALQEFYRKSEWDLSDDRFFLTAGTSEAYTLLFSQFAEADDIVLLPRPGYPLFEQLAGHSRLKTAYYDQSSTRMWQPDFTVLEKMWTERIRFIVVISPNNPTGQILNKSTLAPLAQFCKKHNVILIVDEVFDLFVYETTQILPRPGKMFPDVKTFTLNGISKRFASPDFKLAWIAVSGPTDWCDKSCETLDLANDAFLSANSFSQSILSDLFKNAESFQNFMISSLSQNRIALGDWLVENPDCQTVLPQGGIHGIMKISELPETWDDEFFVLELLKREKLFLHPGYYYDLDEPGTWVVYSLLKEPSAFREGLFRLSRFLKKSRHEVS